MFTTDLSTPLNNELKRFDSWIKSNFFQIYIENPRSFLIMFRINVSPRKRWKWSGSDENHWAKYDSKFFLPFLVKSSVCGKFNIFFNIFCDNIFLFYISFLGKIFRNSFSLAFQNKYIKSELKTLEWDILNPDRLIWISNVHTFDFIVNPLC